MTNVTFTIAGVPVVNDLRWPADSTISGTWQDGAPVEFEVGNVENHGNVQESVSASATSLVNCAFDSLKFKNNQTNAVTNDSAVLEAGQTAKIYVTVTPVDLTVGDPDTEASFTVTPS